MKNSKTVDTYIADVAEWREELACLREILKSSGLGETVKWGMPCYTHCGRNVVGLGAFREWVGLWFFQGALLEDPDKVLINAQPGKTKAMRQWRFAPGQEIDAQQIGVYVEAAMRLAEAGITVKPQRPRAPALPAELDAALTADPAAGSAFDALTPGRQREFADYIATAKRAHTRVRRLRKILPMIVAGQGLNDRYRAS